MTRQALPALDARIGPGGRIDCRLDAPPGMDMDRATLCLSLLAPCEGASGARITASEGSYIELRLDPGGGPSRAFSLLFAPGLGAVNRAWLPLAVHVRGDDGSLCEARTAWERGARPALPRPGKPPEGLRLVPPPTEWRPAEGSLRIERLAPEDGTFGDMLREADALAGRMGMPPLVGAPGANARLRLDEDVPGEGYALDIAKDGIVLAAGDGNGAFHGLVSLLWLREAHRGELPCGRIEDRPRFEWRGQHLDCARHCYRPDTICRLLDLMALLKLNRFHWHFADDEAFRLHLDEFPELARATAMRGEGQLLPGVFGGGIGPTGGSYGHEDVVRIVDHAKRLGIEILPEIEYPAHALCLARLMPELRDPEDTGTEASVQGYRGNVLNPALPSTREFMERLAEAVAARFPFGHLHLGGDELPEGSWSGSPAVVGLKAREGLETADDVMGWAMEKLAGHLRAKGITPCAWEEAARGRTGGIGNDAVIFSWRGQEAGLDAARRGHRVVMCPAQRTYMDMAHTSDPDDWGAAWAAFVSLGDTVDWDPAPDSEPELEERILGVQGAFWSEFTTEDGQIGPMILPRMLGVASKAWSQRDMETPRSLNALTAVPTLVLTPLK